MKNRRLNGHFWVIMLTLCGATTAFAGENRSKTTEQHTEQTTQTDKQAAVAIPKDTSRTAASTSTQAATYDWKTSDKLGKDKPERAALVADFCAKSKNAWEVALTKAEAEALLDDPRTALLYPEKTVSIVAPSMLTRQRQGHVDLLALFLKPERIEAGATFMNVHKKILDEVEKRHGVDREVIVSILMWESKLGTITGDYFAFNSFVTQAFFIDEANAAALSQKGEKGLLEDDKQKKRVEKIRTRARNNLVVLVRVAKARGIDPLSMKGSWAGALGFPQFMPASLRWAEDGDGDGKIDLFTFDDSIASIGKYLKAHGFAKTPESKQKAVWGYNHEKGYVDGVLGFAEALKARRTGQNSSKSPSPSATSEKSSDSSSTSSRSETAPTTSPVAKKK